MSVGVGVIGCGNISEVYLVNAKLFRDIRVVACADIDEEAAKRQADRHGVVAARVADLLKRDDVDVVLNLTIPEAHAEVSLAALEAGKHVYSEKPLATTVADGEQILAAAEQRRLRVGAAPEHDSWRGVPDRASGHRRRQNWPAVVRRRRDHVPWHGTLASEPWLFLPQGRWSRA